MSDVCDNADKRIEKELSGAIRAARETVAHLPGESRCLRCDGANDRAAAGYGVCAGCAEEVRV